MKRGLILLVIIVLVFNIFAQNRGRGGNSQLPDIPRDQSAVFGVVLDKNTRHPIEYANIVVYDASDTTQGITGTVSNARGFFYITGLKPGKYIFAVDFIGYKAIKLPPVEIKSKTDRVRLGRIFLEPVVLQGEGVEVVAERPEISYQIDKKVIDVSKTLTSISGTAVDVLENIPSITVDIEGNVSLRGSSNFQVLIDGVPSVLEGSDALQQIPASSIERIEVITNPSVKYDPDGTSGIINIILKKGKRTGWNGMVNVSGGVDDKYSGDFIINIQNGKWRFYTGANLRHFYMPGDAISRNQSVINNITTNIYSDGISSRQREFYFFRAGATYKAGTNDIVDLSFRVGKMAFERGSDLEYSRFSSDNPVELLYFNSSESRRSGQFFNAILNYKHNFKGDGHEFSARLNYRGRLSDEYTINELKDSTQSVTSGQKNYEEGPNNRIRFEFNYTYPYSPTGKIELGSTGRIGHYDDDTRVEVFDPQLQIYQDDPAFLKNVEYKRNIVASFGQVSDNFRGLKYQLGLRAEYTYRKIAVLNIGEAYDINRWDIFPSFHLSTQLNQNLQVMASYTKRINRPRGWFLEPFETWDDAYNVRKGNPDLDPEYIDSYEAGIQFPWKKNFISLEAYYRVTHNKIERVQQAYSPEVTLHTFENVGKDYALGIEFMANVDLFSWWNTRLMGNVYDYRIKGTLFDQNFDQNSFNWSARFNNSIAFSKRSQLQLNVIYNSPTVSSQGEREEFYTVNLGLKYDIIPKTLTATLQVRDLFSTSKFEFTTNGPDFTRYNYFSMDAPVVMLNFRYFLNNYKPKRERDQNGDMNGMEEGEDF